MGIKDWFKKPEEKKPDLSIPDVPISHEQYIRRAAQLHDHEYCRGFKSTEVGKARSELARRYYNQPEVIAERREQEAKHREYNRIYMAQQKAQEAKLTAKELEEKRKADLEKAKQFAKKKTK